MKPFTECSIFEHDSQIFQALARIGILKIASSNCSCLTSDYATRPFVEAQAGSGGLKILRFCCRLLLIISTGMAAYLLCFGGFDFSMANPLHTENDPIGRGSL